MVKKTDSLMKEIEAMFPRLAVLDMMDNADNIREYLGVSVINLLAKFWSKYDNHVTDFVKRNNFTSTHSSVSAMPMS